MSLIVALTAALALSAPPADLSDLKPADRADLQCMTLVVAAMGASEDLEAAAGLASGATFYYGRLQGRTPGTDWLARLAAYARTEPGESLEANRQRCAQEMQTLSEAFTSMGTSMQGS